MLAEIFFTPAGGAIICTPYLQDFLDELKKKIPAAYRHWDRENRQWYIEPGYAEKAANLFWTFFPDGDSFDLARKHREPPEWAKVLFVQEDAPLEVIEAAYRTLSKIHHPDRGGSEAQMKLLNEAIQGARDEKARNGGRRGSDSVMSSPCR